MKQMSFVCIWLNNQIIHKSWGNNQTFLDAYLTFWSQLVEKIDTTGCQSHGIHAPMHTMIYRPFDSKWYQTLNYSDTLEKCLLTL